MHLSISPSLGDDDGLVSPKSLASEDHQPWEDAPGPRGTVSAHDSVWRQAAQHPPQTGPGPSYRTNGTHDVRSNGQGKTAARRQGLQNLDALAAWRSMTAAEQALEAELDTGGQYGAVGPQAVSSHDTFSQKQLRLAAQANVSAALQQTEGNSRRAGAGRIGQQGTATGGFSSQPAAGALPGSVHAPPARPSAPLPALGLSLPEKALTPRRNGLQHHPPFTSTDQQRDGVPAPAPPPAPSHASPGYHELIASSIPASSLDASAMAQRALQKQPSLHAKLVDGTNSHIRSQAEAVTGKHTGADLAMEYSSGPQEWTRAPGQRAHDNTGSPGSGLYRRAVERKARLAERYAAVRAEAEAALAEHCTFTPNISGAHQYAPRTSAASPRPHRTPATTLGPSQPKRSQPSFTAAVVPSQHARPQQVPPLGMLTSGLSLAYAPAGQLPRRAAQPSAVEPELSFGLPTTSGRALGNSVAAQPPGESEPQLGSSQKQRQELEQQESRRIAAGLRLYGRATESQRQKDETRRLLQEAEVESWRRSRPVARPLSAGVYGAEAIARLAALRGRSPSPLPRQRPVPLPSGMDECTFSPRTNRRRAVTPPPPQGGAAAPTVLPRLKRAPSAPRTRPTTAAVSPRVPLQASLQPCAHSLAAALIENAARMGLEVGDGRACVAADLDFSEFLARQHHFIQARDAKLAREQAQLTANRHPSMSVGSRRILAQNPSLDHFMPLHATLTRTQKGQLAGFEGCSFQPTILPVSAAKPGRGVAELSLGDAMRRALTREQLADDLQRTQALNDTFKPKTLANPRVTSRVELDSSSGVTIRQLQQHREQLRLANQRAQEERDLLECTFSPKTGGIPAYIQRMARCHASRTSHDAKENQPQRFYDTSVPLRSVASISMTSVS